MESIDFHILEHLDVSAMNTTGTRHQNRSTEFEIIMHELQILNGFWARMEKIFRPLELFIYAIGLAGNFLALITLTRSKKMSTPSFSYHRALVAADFLYCLNFFALLLTHALLTVECREGIFRYWIGAFYAGTLNHVISNVCSYSLHYVTMVIALDRVLALLFAVGYHNWNRPIVAKIVISIAVVMSTGVHSWSTLVQNEVNEYRRGQENYDHDTHQLRLSDPCWNDSIIYYYIPRTGFSNSTARAMKAKEYYNGTWRIAYACVLTILTMGVIVGLVRRRRRRDAARSSVHLTSVPSVDRTTTIVHERRSRKCSTESTTSEAAKKRRNRASEKVLFVLMIAVLVLAFFQVAASETNRILQMLYPPSKLPSRLDDAQVPLKEKIWYIRISMYSHFNSRVLSKAFTAVERSFVCILYIAMNALFRRELLAMLKALCLGRLCNSCRRKYQTRIGSKQSAHRSEAGHSMIDHQETSRFIVVDLEPNSGCHLRVAPMQKRSNSRMV